ncbi:MAG TPA: hypothetical protein VGP22_05085, partial [Albitalea sp.]|nr:hypothetical protein [Albitalea sp.]
AVAGLGPFEDIDELFLDEIHQSHGDSPSMWPARCGGRRNNTTLACNNDRGGMTWKPIRH